MRRLRRREFLQATCAATSTGFALVAQPGAGQAPADRDAGGRALLDVDDSDGGLDLAVVNARAYTVDDKLPRAEALGVRRGRFEVVGTNEAVRARIVKRTKVLDAAGQTVVPGFIDAHTHPAAAGAEHLMYVDCNQPTIAAIQAELRRRLSKQQPGQWVIGFKYDDTKLTDGRPLSRTDLDEVSDRTPIRVSHRGGHTAVYNSAAFQLAGVTPQTPDPQGGRFIRDAQGNLTGLVAERAVDAVKRLPIPTRPQAREGVKLISQLMTAAGITSVHDADADLANFTAYQDARAAGELLFRTYVMANAALFEHWQAAGMRTGLGDDRLRIGGLKLYADGSASERTMRMSTPYVGRPDDYGMLVTTQDKLNEQVLAAHANDWQVGVHANGDVAIDMVLNAYELAQRLHPRRDPRFRIEHCTLVNDDLLKRIAELGAIPTPFYTYVYYHGDKWAQYGEEKTRSMFAHRSFLDHGIRVAGASDYVPGPFEPLTAIQSMVTRTDYRGRTWGENQKITVAEALHICTLHGAYASFEEREKGSITVGKLADFVLLADDPHEVEPSRIKDISVVRTVVGGRTVHPLNVE